MSEQKKQSGPWPAVLISAIILAVLIIWPGCKKQPAKKPGAGHSNHEHLLSEPLAREAGKSTRTDTEPLAASKPSLNDVIRARRSWDPVFTSWHGKPAPDFTLTDITGKQHKLSDYRGKNVIITFWATWCRFCKMEVPYLVALRNLKSKDELAILAISVINPFTGETPDKVKAYVGNSPMNYTVISAEPSALPEPYNRVQGLPSAFFIDKEGKIKIATSGAVLEDIEAVLQAE